MRYLATTALALALVAGACTKTQTQPGEARSATTSAKPDEQAAPGAKPRVEVKTTMGSFTMELYPDKAPIGVKNFLAYVKKGFYDGTIFHRVIGPPKNFMIQGGGFTPDMEKKPTDPPIKNEATNGLLNERGTVAFARTRVVDSATSQFFVNLKHNAFLDHRDTSPMGYGYAVFGKVVSGMEVVDKIASVPTTTKGPHGDVPVTPVVIESVTVK